MRGPSSGSSRSICEPTRPGRRPGPVEGVDRARCCDQPGGGQRHGPVGGKALAPIGKGCQIRLGGCAHWPDTGPRLSTLYRRPQNPMYADLHQKAHPGPNLSLAWRHFLLFPGRDFAEDPWCGVLMESGGEQYGDLRLSAALQAKKVPLAREDGSNRYVFSRGIRQNSEIGREQTLREGSSVRNSCSRTPSWEREMSGSGEAAK